MDNRTCKKCGHLCHCIESDHEGCRCDGCDCNNYIHEPDKSYTKLEQEKAEQDTYETNGLVIDSTDDCESCQ